MSINFRDFERKVEMECFNFCYFYVALTSELMESLATAQPRFLRT